MPDIYLPNIIKLELTNFSLYCEQSVVMDFSKPVSCLMGANGIGKSTLLNCVNFAITGRINPTNKKLKSIDTLDRGNNYYLQYFDGRISEVDKDYASTRIVFMLGNKRIEVVRNFFPDNSILEYKLDNETQDPRNYEDDVVRLANLNNYAQFVFLQLKVLYDGCNAQKWGYGFARNKYGAPVSIELMEEVEFLCAKGYLSKDSSGYYRISDTASLNSILSISKSGILGWRSKYIEVVFDSLLTKSFPRVVRAVQNEPGISLLESINRTSTLLESSLINALYEDFGVLKEIIGDPQIDLVVPASLWIDYLSVQKQ